MDVIEFNHGLDTITTKRPFNIGHRGSAGTLPPNTIEGCKQAIEDGADVIECDVQVTKDKQLICAHDNYLKHTTDVANRAKFRDRQTSHVIPIYGYVENITNDWFAVDFTLAELKTLRKVQPDELCDKSHDGKYLIPSLQEFLDFVKSVTRPIVVYIESKGEEWINTMPFMNGTLIEQLILDVVHAHGFTKSTDPCILQSFSEISTYYFHNNTELPIVMNIWTDVPNR